MTLAVMESFGVTVNNRKFRRFDVRPAHYKGCEYAVEPDASAASYFFALAALTGGDVTVEGLGTVEHSRRHGVRGRARTHGLHRHARAEADHGHRRARCARSTST